MILVTGGCGFVGSNLVSYLIDQGHDVRVLDNLSRGRLEYLDGFDVEIINADIRSKEACLSAFKDVEQVVHLAAYGSVVESVQDPVLNFEMNVLGTFNILQLSVSAEVSKLVFSSTGGALIGDATPPVNESSLPKPISPYGASKLCCEAYCHAFSRSFDLNSVCLRFANVYGPNSLHKTGVINKYFEAISDGSPLVIYGDGTSSRDYIHVSDLVRGIYLALTNEQIENEIFHIAKGDEITLSQLAQTARIAAGQLNHPVVYEPVRKGEVDRNFANFDHARKVLGFSPRVELEDGLSSLWHQYYAN